MNPSIQTPPPCARLALIVPCYNEAHRLKIAAWHAHLAEEPNDWIVFVDDGSTDGTLEMLTGFVRTHPRVEAIHLSRNLGKAGAVRYGIMHALRLWPSEYIGYWDADLSTSLTLVHDFMTALDHQPEALAAIGVRRQDASHKVHRPAWRRFSSWAFAHAASAALGMRFRDTQCGAKVFRRRAAENIFREPFLSPWLFDVEVMARLIQFVGRKQARSAISEVHLREWRDTEKSRFFSQYASQAPRDLLRIWWRY
ncbi:MAG: glycosyltransferase [Verrucomicrobiia bacterium]